MQADVLDAREVLRGEFDRVFVSWGAICWLPDLRPWARVAASLLKPEGRLVLAEGHPVTLCFEERDGRIEVACDWTAAPDRPLAFAEATTYTGDPRALANRNTYEWIHSLTSIFAEAGIPVRSFTEHEVVPWRLFPMLVPTDLDEDGIPTAFRLPEGRPRLPLSFSLTSVRNG